MILTPRQQAINNWRGPVEIIVRTDNPTKADVSDAAHILIENSLKDVRIAEQSRRRCHHITDGRAAWY